MNKVFRCSDDTCGKLYGFRVFIDCREEEVPNDIRKTLDSLSIWGGSTSNIPEEYSMWEFPTDALAYSVATEFLRKEGWETTLPVPGLAEKSVSDTAPWPNNDWSHPCSWVV